MLIQCLWRCYAADKAFNSHATWHIYVKDVNTNVNNSNTPLGKVNTWLSVSFDLFFYGGEFSSLTKGKWRGVRQLAAATIPMA